MEKTDELEKQKRYSQKLEAQLKGKPNEQKDRTLCLSA